MIFNVSLPTIPPKSDIETRELTVIIDNIVANTIKITDLNQVTVDGIRAPVDSIVTLELRDVDATWQHIVSTTHEFAVVDSIPPPAPGALGAIIVGEDITDDPPQEPLRSHQ
jgi:hypothetical protein